MIDHKVIEQAMEAAASAAAAQKLAFDAIPHVPGKGHRGSAIWDYDKCLDDALRPFVPDDKNERREFYVAVLDLAYMADRGREYATPWTGYTIVGAALSSKIAWLTPGFAEARAYNNLYGS